MSAVVHYDETNMTEEHKCLARLNSNNEMEYNKKLIKECFAMRQGNRVPAE